MIEIKIGLFGQFSTGKTSILKQYIEGTFDPFLAADTIPRREEKYLTIDSNNVLVKIWDLPGSKCYYSMTRQYFSGLDGIMLVYENTDYESFEMLDTFIKMMNKEIDINSVELFLVSNIKDKESKKYVTKEEGKEYATKIGSQFYEVNAKTGEGIEKCFMDMIKVIYDKTKAKVKENQNKNTKKKKKKCIIF